MNLQKRIYIFLLLLPIFLFSGKIELQKAVASGEKRQVTHPLEQYFSKSIDRKELSEQNRAEDNRLLVMLIEFVEDSDPTTTGNGKFLFTDDEYLIDLGKPPHDQEYFWWVMESVRYYYQAASLGAFNLDFDIYPQHNYTEADSEIFAYTLRKKMNYYNPIGVDTATMISRFEEYFHDVFTEVDKDEDVVFSQYSHFMIIHAGSDSQHDIAGDTRSDIPSFFINVGDGKEVIVDDGIVIDHACNVPETISQDGQYGVTTAVTAHEFGHSLGFIDLYSTLTGSSQVGWFDIMDSGGMGDLNLDGVDIEGGLPTLPSAWHRILAWEDYFREHGFLKDIDELGWSEPITVNPAEKLLSGINSDDPYFIKIPLTDTEYLLVENRQVDPDGDSGLSFKGALPQSNDPNERRYRILLYPTYPADDPRDDPNWEYDLFIPGWQIKNETEEKYYNYGGGLVIWHIDDEIIYETGDWEDGVFYSNYDQNTVNALHSKRGVKVIEADGFDDIGNYADGYNIMGSAYDPFYLYNPLFSENGNFLGWDDAGMVPGYQPVNEDKFIHTIDFNGSSFPRLETNDGDPFMFGFRNISSYSIDVDVERSMSFSWGSHLYDDIQVMAEYEDIQAISNVANVLGFPSLAIVTSDKIEMMTLVGDTWDNYFDVHIPFDYQLDQPVLSMNADEDSGEEIMIVSDSVLTILDGVEISQEIFSSALSDLPMYIRQNNMISIYPLTDKLIIDDEELDVPNAKLSYDQQQLIAAKLIAANRENIWFIDPIAKQIINKFELSPSDVDYYPVVLKTLSGYGEYSFQAVSNGDIYRFAGDEKKLIFQSSDYCDAAPSQLLLSPLKEGGRTRLIFAAGEYLFAITKEGTLEQGFPVYMEDKNIVPGIWLQAFKLNGEYLIRLQRDTGAVFAVNGNGDYRLDLSAAAAGNSNSQYWYDDVAQELVWFGGNSALWQGNRYDVNEIPLINRGYRNDEYNSFTSIVSDEPQEEDVFRGYAFPNPVKSDYAFIRIFDAKESINLKFYDIAGNLIREDKEELEDNPYQDIRLDLAGISSGVYYARIKSGSKSLTIPLGIEK